MKTFVCRDDALVEISHDNCPEGKIRLLASLNPDANLGPQIEEYDDRWTLTDLSKVASGMLSSMEFYRDFNEINGRTSGGITLIDNMTDDEIAKYFSDGETTEMTMERFSEALPKLKDGIYHVF